MVEWYWGQGESLLEYEESRSMIRVGYVIKSNEFNFFRMKNQVVLDAAIDYFAVEEQPGYTKITMVHWESANGLRLLFFGFLNLSAELLVQGRESGGFDMGIRIVKFFFSLVNVFVKPIPKGNGGPYGRPCPDSWIWIKGHFEYVWTLKCLFIF